MARVLIADDEGDIRDLLGDILFDHGYDVMEAADGGQALEMARRERPDVVLLDVLMPVMDGLQVLRRLRQDPATEAMPVILLTAFSMLDEEPRELSTGITRHLSKPWPRGAVEGAVQEALEEAGQPV